MARKNSDEDEELAGERSFASHILTFASLALVRDKQVEARCNLCTEPLRVKEAPAPYRWLRLCTALAEGSVDYPVSLGFSQRK